MSGVTKANTGPVPGARPFPTAPLMHLSFLLTGLGTALLGPILPLLTRQWHLSDSHAGLLLMAQFCGSFSGGVSVSRHLRRSLGLGLGSAGLGFLGFALAPGLALACVALLFAGFGLGQVITSVNILAGRRYTEHRASALALLNFSWSLGAVLSPLLAALLTPHFALRSLIECFAASFLLMLGVFALERAGAPAAEQVRHEHVATAARGLARQVFVYFCLLLFLYGGLETCLSGWLTTFALRYGDRNLLLSEYTTTLLWVALTAGRGISSGLLLRVSVRGLQRASLAAAALLTAALALAHSAVLIALFATLLGLSLAPFFPATFALLMAREPSAREAGVVLAVSGLGAASLPWLMGVVSTRTHSLQIALALPFAAAVALLGLSLLPRLTPVSAPDSHSPAGV